MAFSRRRVTGLVASTFLLSCLVFFQNCAKPSSGGENAAPVPKGSREIGMDILDTTPSTTFSDNIALAKAVGAGYMILGLGWNQIEPSTPSDCGSAGTYIDPYNALATFNSTLPASGLKLSLSILPISTNINMMPSNLAAKDLDDALVICRFQKMLSFVFSKIPNVQLLSMQFGNEIDLYPAANQVSFWGQYWNLFAQASTTAKSLRPGLKTSVVSTLYGATGLTSNPVAKDGLKQFYSGADVVVVTYYPLNSNFTVKNPTVIDAEVSSLVSLYPAKQIYFNEIGYPSGSTYDASSEALQKEYVTQVFKTWDKFSNQIQSISFLRLNDLSQSAAQSTANSYGLGSNNQFIEYLQTLGLRTYNGEDKQSYAQIKRETSSRGW